MKFYMIFPALGILILTAAFIIEVGKWKRDKSFYTKKQKAIRSVNFAFTEIILFTFLFDSQIQDALPPIARAFYFLGLCILIIAVLCLIYWDYKILKDRTRGLL